MGSGALPPASDLPVSALAGLFRQTTNSYKFLLFLALLEELGARRGAAGVVSIPVRALAVRMLTVAWYPHVFFRLSFGRQDKVAERLDALGVASKRRTPDARMTQEIRAAIDARLDDAAVDELLRYVEARLIRPFFAGERLRGCPDHHIDARIAVFSREGFESDRPLYRIPLEAREVHVHPAWARYLEDNHAIVKGWALFAWAGYMQKRNPNVPAVAEKLTPEIQRGSLTRQRRFWQTALRELDGAACIYTQAPLDLDDLALDHFVPWTFVVHDQPWNLVPVSKTVNSQKGDRLPFSTHVPRLADLHARALAAARPAYAKAGQWEDLVEPYVSDLGVPMDRLVEPDPDALVGELCGRYAETVRPLLDLARARGFERWSSSSAP